MGQLCNAQSKSRFSKSQIGDRTSVRRSVGKGFGGCRAAGVGQLEILAAQANHRQSVCETAMYQKNAIKMNIRIIMYQYAAACSERFSGGMPRGLTSPSTRNATKAIVANITANSGTNGGKARCN